MNKSFAKFTEGGPTPAGHLAHDECQALGAGYAVARNCVPRGEGPVVLEFDYTALPSHVFFGAGAVRDPLAHCAEAFRAPGRNPITSVIAEEGIRAMAQGLPDLVADGHDLDATR